MEQNQLYTPPGSIVALASGQRPSFHMSPLARLLREKKKAKSGRILLPEAPDEDCNTIGLQPIDSSQPRNSATGK
jgi:hypothetical protein